MAYSNPYNAYASKPLYVDFTATRSVVKVKVRIYTAAYRLVRSVDASPSLISGYVAGNIDASNLQGLANGTYYYVIEAGSGTGEKASSGINKIIILK